jgi:hypothetical protein
MRILDLHLRILFSSEITMTKHNFSQRLRESVITCKSRPWRKYTNTCGAAAASTSFLCASSQLAVAANSQGKTKQRTGVRGDRRVSEGEQQSQKDATSLIRAAAADSKQKHRHKTIRRCGSWVCFSRGQDKMVLGCGWERKVEDKL